MFEAESGAGAAFRGISVFAFTVVVVFSAMLLRLLPFFSRAADDDGFSAFAASFAEARREAVRTAIFRLVFRM